jgi:2-oxoisovalerate dehydrogenase E1 component alpha subunit
MWTRTCSALRNISWGHKFNADFITSMSFKDNIGGSPMFRVMDENGKILNSKYENIDKDLLLKIYALMRKLNVTDTFLNTAQRQNRINFYMTASGEEASTIGLGVGLILDDVVFPQYREQGALMWRGFTVQNMVDQCIGNCKESSKGRNMPIHYSSKELNWVSTSSPLCTQVPQAVGAGYLMRVQGQNKVSVACFAEGSASEGDAHAAMNFASTLKSQTLFYGRNNMYAISTPSDDQYSGEGIAARAKALGISSIRVDGNDLFAVVNSVKYAREMIVKEKRPYLIESMSYRIGDHSTSDFSKTYRDEVEMTKWNDYIAKMSTPIARMDKYLRDKKLIPNVDEFNQKVDEEAKLDVMNSLKKAEQQKKPNYLEMFNDVYHEMPESIKEQKEEFLEHLKKHGKEYGLEHFEN